VSVGGRVVVNLSGGWRDSARRQSWTADTLVSVFSVGEGLLAACAARLASERQLDPDGPGGAVLA
jgi:CubicO group peptidase (beta-lactamase class C family)